jgi:exodeoxyribonuclease-3
MRRFESHVKTLNHRGKPYVIAADWNVAHREIDLKNWRSNQRNPGFLPEERQWIEGLIKEQGLVDVFRTLAPEQVMYTWWSHRGAAFANDVGWRLDYQLAHPEMAARARAWQVNREPRFSDHAPFTVDYDIALS